MIAGILIACTGVALTKSNSDTTFKIGLINFRS